MAFSQTHQYFYVAEVVPTVGQIVAFFIERLVNTTDISLQSLHCIGHSLGAHVCGFAGKAIHANKQDKIGRITGLDPAWPGFWMDQKTIDKEGSEPSDISHLYKTDAHLVTILHTSTGWNTGFGKFIGNPNKLGHFDFWINGGEVEITMAISLMFFVLGGIQPFCSEVPFRNRMKTFIWDIVQSLSLNVSDTFESELSSI